MLEQTSNGFIMSVRAVKDGQRVDKRFSATSLDEMLFIVQAFYTEEQ